MDSIITFSQPDLFMAENSNPAPKSIFNTGFGQTIIYGTNILSIAGCILLFYYYFKSKRTISIKMINILGIIDLLFAIFSLVERIFPKTDAFCNIQQFGIRTLMSLSLFWCATIAYLSFKFLVTPMYATQKFLLMKWITICTFFSALISIGPCFQWMGIEYGVSNDGTDCSLLLLSNSSSSLWAIYGFLTGPFLVAIIITVTCYAKQARMLWSSRELIERVNAKLKRLIWFPAGQIILFGPTILSIGLILAFNIASDGLLLVEYGFLHLLGLVNFLTYGLQRTFKKKRKNTDKYVRYEYDDDDDDDEVKSNSSSNKNSFSSGATIEHHFRESLTDVEPDRESRIGESV